MTFPQAPPGTGPRRTPVTRPPRTHPRRRSHRRWIWLTGVALTARVGVPLIWFQPQKLLYDQRVDEPAPTATSQPTAGSAATSTSEAGTRELASGVFVSRE